MLETVLQFKIFLLAHLPEAVVPFVMFGLGLLGIYLIVLLLDILFKLVKVIVVAGLAVGLIYILMRV